MHEESLAQATRSLFDTLAGCQWVSQFYLAGGTALALRLGHRVSVDLDFFSTGEFDESAVIEQLAGLGKVEIFKKEHRSVIGSINGVKFSFFGYSYPLLFPTENFRGIKIASVGDVACMKLDAISSRGTKRDFVDLYFICKDIPLSELLRLFSRKFASVKYNLVHIKKSLVFFEDAEGDPMPNMLIPVDWDTVKTYFQTEAVKERE